MLPESSLGRAIEIGVGSSQPVVYGVAAGTILGLHINDWIMVGTGILLVLNLGLSVTRIVSLCLRAKTKESK
mgnify:CR=1 FL=1